MVIAMGRVYRKVSGGKDGDKNAKLASVCD